MNSQKLAEAIVANNKNTADLISDIERLKSLIKSVEFSDSDFCPWCDSSRYDVGCTHKDHCEAFNQDGTVK